MIRILHILIFVQISFVSFSQDSLKFFLNETGHKIRYEGDSLNGERDGFWIIYDFFGKKASEGNYIQGKKDGIWSYYVDGLLKERGKYLDDKREGWWDFTPFEGLVGSGYYKNGKREGEWIYKYQGQINEIINYKDSLKDGWHTAYYMTGEFRFKVFNIKGKKHGDYKTYHINGKIYETCKYDHGIPTTDFLQYDRDGSLFSKLTFKNGEDYKEEIFNKQGQVIETYLWDKTKNDWVPLIK